MMFFSSTTCRIVLVLAAACNAVTSAKEAKVELSKDHRPALRGNAATPVESLADAHGRMLDTTAAGYSVQAGAAIVFTHPPTVIHGGNVCAFGAVTGIYGIDYAFTHDATGVFVPDPDDSGSKLITSAHCDPTAGTGVNSPSDQNSLFYILGDKLTLPPLQNPIETRDLAHYTVIDAELGGQTFYPGIYFASSLTMAANTQVTLKGSGVFQFISGSTMVTGAGTKVLLEAHDGTNTDDVDECGEKEYAAIECGTGTAAGSFTGTPASQQIEWVVTAAATLGALSEVKGSIMARAAITLGEKAKVSGCILALAGVTLGAACDINEDKVNSPSQLDTNTR
jgi:hypothetical protein